MARKLIVAKTRKQAVAIGMSKVRKMGHDGQVMKMEMHDWKHGIPSPKSK